MIAIFAEQISCSGDTHEHIVAVFTTTEKAEHFLGKLKDYFPKEHFYMTEYFAPKVDPDFDTFIIEGSNDEDNTFIIEGSKLDPNDEDNYDLVRMP